MYMAHVLCRLNQFDCSLCHWFLRAIQWDLKAPGEVSWSSEFGSCRLRGPKVRRPKGAGHNDLMTGLMIVL